MTKDKNGVHVGSKPISSKDETNESMCRKVCRAYPGLFEYLSSRPEMLKWHEGYVVFDRDMNKLRIKCYQDGAPKFGGTTENELFELYLTPEEMQANGILMPA